MPNSPTPEGLSPPDKYRVTPMRWFVLFYFSLLSCNQCLAWFSFSSLSMPLLQEYFGAALDKATIDLLLNWGPIIGVVFFPVQTWLLQQKHGLQRGIWLGLHLQLAGCVIRCVPILITEASGWKPGSPDATFAQSSAAFAMYHIGQILIAAAGPLVMGTVTRLAVVWFPEDERTTATAIAQTANGLGTTVGFLNPQWLATSSASVPNIFWFSLVLAVVSEACACFYLPPTPPSPPSAAAAATFGTAATAPSPDPSTAAARAVDAVLSSNHALPLLEPAGSTSSTIGVGGGSEASGGGLRNYVATVCVAFSSRSYMLLVLVASLLSGVLIGWQGLLQSILGPTSLSPSAVSWVGFANGLAINVGAILAARVMDTWLQRRLKLGLLVGLGGCLLSTAWFTLQLPCSLYPTERMLVPRSEVSLVVAITLAGLCQGAITPLFYELAAELVYPVREGMSAGILVMLLNTAAGVLIFCNNALPESDMNLIATITIAVTILVLAFAVKEEYRRPQDVKG